MMDRPQPTLASSQPTTPAWLLSLMMHIFVVLLLALLLRASPPRGFEERPRDIEIVLAKRETPNQTVYYDEPDDISESAANAAPETPASEAALPDSAALENMAAIGLPALEPLRTPLADLPHTLPNRRAGGRPRILPGLGDAAIIAADPLYGKKTVKLAPKTSLSLFGSAPALGRSFVFVIDRSKSMGSSGLDVLSAAERELETALRNLKPAHQFQIIAYHQRLTYFERGRLSAATDKNKADATTFVGSLIAVGGTAHLTAILAAVRLRPDVVFLLTDGDEPGLNSAQQKRVLQESAGRVTFFCLEFGRGKHRHDEPDFMQQLARKTGGDYHYIDRQTR